MMCTPWHLFRLAGLAYQFFACGVSWGLGLSFTLAESSVQGADHRILIAVWSLWYKTLASSPATDGTL